MVFEKNPLIASEIVSSVSLNFLAAMRMPPPAKPAKISLNEMLSLTHPAILPMTSAIRLRTSSDPRPTDPATSPSLSPNVLKPFPAASIHPAMVWPTVASPLATVLNTPILRMDVSSPTKKSPSRALHSRSVLRMPLNSLPPNTRLRADIKASSACFPTSNTANIPLNARLNWSNCSAVGFNPSENCLNFSVMEYS